MIFITTLVLLFILRLRFPANQPISHSIRKRYGVPTVQAFRSLEKVLRRRDKVLCDLEYLQSCLHYSTIPKFLRIKLYKRILETTPLCKTWQLKLLQSEIRFKTRKLNQCNSQVLHQQGTLRTLVSRLDYSCINLWLQNKQKNAISQTRATHSAKLHKLGISPISVTLDPSKVIYNYSDRVLTNSQKHALLLGLDFNLPIRHINFNKYFFAFEKLIATYSNFDIFNHIPNAVNELKGRLKCIANKYYYNFKPHKNICPLFNKNHLISLKSLASDKDLYITKPDKGQGVVILNKLDYINKVHDVIDDASTFTKLTITEQQLVTKLEDKLNNQLRKLKANGSLPDSFYDKAYSSGSKIGFLYGLPKIHKDNCPIRPILSACSTHNYQLAKLLVPFLSNLAVNEYSLSNSYEFSTSINSINNANNFYMCSFDIVSLYTNVPVNESIAVILDCLFANDSSLYEGFTREEFKKLLELTLMDSYFKFNGSIYKQITGLSMGSPISPLIANIFLNKFETSILNNCPVNFKPQFYKRYLDDTFLLFKDEQQSKQFFNYINSKHNNIKFTFEGESEQCLPFLDVFVKRTEKYVYNLYLS